MRLGEPPFPNLGRYGTKRALRGRAKPCGWTPAVRPPRAGARGAGGQRGEDLGPRPAPPVPLRSLLSQPRNPHIPEHSPEIHDGLVGRALGLPLLPVRGAPQPTRAGGCLSFADPSEQWCLSGRRASGSRSPRPPEFLSCLPEPTGTSVGEQEVGGSSVKFRGDWGPATRSDRAQQCCRVCGVRLLWGQRLVPPAAFKARVPEGLGGARRPAWWWWQQDLRGRKAPRPPGTGGDKRSRSRTCLSHPEGVRWVTC